MQFTRDVRLRRPRVNSIAVDSQEVLHILSVFFFALVIQNAHHITSLLRRIILSSVACQAVPYLAHYLINGTIFGKKSTI